MAMDDYQITRIISSMDRLAAAMERMTQGAPGTGGGGAGGMPTGVAGGEAEEMAKERAQREGFMAGISPGMPGPGGMVGGMGRQAAGVVRGAGQRIAGGVKRDVFDTVESIVRKTTAIGKVQEYANLKFNYGHDRVSNKILEFARAGRKMSGEEIADYYSRMNRQGDIAYEGMQQLRELSGKRAGALVSKAEQGAAQALGGGSMLADYAGDFLSDALGGLADRMIGNKSAAMEQNYRLQRE
jgi:hypothetical protein